MVSQLARSVELSPATSADRPLDRILARLPGHRPAGANRWQALCPAHQDHSPSLSIREGDDGRALVLCRAGCSTEAVLTALGLTWSDLFPQSVRPASVPTRQTEYHYRDAGGALVAIKVRTDGPKGKATPWQRPDGQWGLDGLKIAALPLFRLPELLAADMAAPVLLCEGEKATDAARAFGFVAVCNAGGAGQTDFGGSLAPLAGRRLYLWPDNDQPGRALMDRLADALEGVATAVYRLDVPGAGPKDDAADFLGSADDLAALVASAPLYREWTVKESRQAVADRDARIADLEAALARERADRETTEAALTDRVAVLTRERADARDLNRAVFGVLANPAAKSVGRSGIGIVRHVASLQSRADTPRDDAGRVRTSRAALAAASGVAAGTISAHLAVLHEHGIVDKVTVVGHTPGRQADRAIFVKLTAPTLVAALGDLASITATSAPGRGRKGGYTWGGYRICPDCGPGAGIVTRTTVCCRRCGQILEEFTDEGGSFQLATTGNAQEFDDPTETDQPAADPCSAAPSFDVSPVGTFSFPSSQLEPTENTSLDESLNSRPTNSDPARPSVPEAFSSAFRENRDEPEAPSSQLEPTGNARLEETDDEPARPAELLALGAAAGWPRLRLRPPDVIFAGRAAWTRWANDPDNGDVLTDAVDAARLL